MGIPSARGLARLGAFTQSESVATLVQMHRRQLFALGGAAFGAGSATTWLLDKPPARWLQAGSDEADGQAQDDGNAKDDNGDDEVVEDPRSGFAQVIWSVETDAPLAALTFDDGPDPDFTPRILDLLDLYGVKATFMAMGHNAEEYPELLARIRDSGHEIGHHSWRHLNLAVATVEDTRKEIDVGARKVAESAGVDMRWFRPPKGRLTEAALRLVAKQHNDVVLWSVTRGALAERSPRRVADHIVDDVGRGDIILLHDGIGRGTFEGGSLAEELTERRSTEVDALPEVLERIHNGGIRLGTVSELVETWKPRRSPPQT